VTLSRRFRSVDSNDSGDISFSEFSIWLVHWLGPNLMQKISESVQHMQVSSPDKSTTPPPQVNPSPRVAQATPSTSPYNISRVQFSEKHSSSVSPSLSLKQSANMSVGSGSSQQTFYFGLQVIPAQLG
jgi:hypothetical protein